MRLSSSIIFILQSALVISQCPFTGKVTDSKNCKFIFQKSNVLYILFLDGKTLIQNYADSSKPVVQRVNYEDVMKALEKEDLRDGDISSQLMKGAFLCETSLHLHVRTDVHVDP